MAEASSGQLFRVFLVGNETVHTIFEDACKTYIEGIPHLNKDAREVSCWITGVFYIDGRSVIGTLYFDDICRLALQAGLVIFESGKIKMVDPPPPAVDSKVVQDHFLGQTHSDLIAHLNNTIRALDKCSEVIEGITARYR